MPLPFIIGGLAALGSAIGGAAATAGGVAVGAATAVGTAAASTAVGSAAIGAATAVSGAAAAAGGAAVGAATAVGTAAASTAVGGAAIGAMEAVGGAVAGIAGASSSIPGIGLAAAEVAKVAGTQAGAAALGTITTTGTVGAVSSVSGAAQISEASNIKNAALVQYDKQKEKFEKVQENTNSKLKQLGEEKLKIWESFERFSIMYSKIQNPPKMNGKFEEESLSLKPDELDNIKAVAIKAKELLSGGMASVGVGNVIGIATSGGLMSSVTMASTGTAISTLSGAAATNATMAALGGGSLAAGGAGMAGGAAIMSGLTFAPMLMAGGILLHGKGKKALSDAKDIQHEVDKAVISMEEAIKELKKVEELSVSIRLELDKLREIYIDNIEYMENLVKRKADYLEFDMTDRRMLEKTVLSLKLLKQLSMQNILDPQKENTVLEREVRDTLQCVKFKKKESLNS